MNSILQNINSPDDLKKIDKVNLPKLCEEIRDRIISVMTKNGGHLASSLGVVELTVVLHYVFDAPNDLVIFDVGHQSYTHKIITGRNDRFDTVRLKDGISGFTRRKESIYDHVDSGHSSTSISQAIGFAISNKINNRDNHIAVVIGDGALTGGVAFEGLNFCGHRDLPIIIILNDNEMSIGQNVGSISRHFAEIALTKQYQKLTDIYTNVMKRRRGIIRFFFWFAKKIERVFKLFLGHENIFLNLGFEYVGPIDGHNIDKLINIFKKIKNNVRRPIVVHIKTMKGKGYERAEDNPVDFHGVTPHQMANEVYKNSNNKSFTEVFSEKIVELNEKHKNIVAITAAMEDGTGLKKFKERYPESFFDVGIAEQNGVTMASTLAYSGLKPIFAVYSTFLQRALDQLVQDVAISMAPVIIALDRAGIVGPDGETHQGQFDISFLRMIPNIQILAPCDANELRLMLDYGYDINRPVIIRYPKDNAFLSQLDGNHPPILDNPFVMVKDGKDILIVVIGPFVTLAKEIASILKDSDIDTGILYLRMLKPISDDDIYKIIEGYNGLFVIEENVLVGSVSEYLGTLVAKRSKNIKFDSQNIPDEFIEQDSRDSILKNLGYNREYISQKIIAMFR